MGDSRLYLPHLTLDMRGPFITQQLRTPLTRAETGLAVCFSSLPAFAHAAPAKSRRLVQEVYRNMTEAWDKAMDKRLCCVK